MKTIKLNIKENKDILEEIRIFSNLVRISFNRFQDNYTEKQIKTYLNKIYKTNSWFIRSAIRFAKGLYLLNGNKKIIFGGKRNLIQYIKGKINKEEYKNNRMLPLTIIGEYKFKGNRLFEFDLKKLHIIYKPNRKKHIDIYFLKPNKKLFQELMKIQQFSLLKKLPITVKLTKNNIYLTYDESLINNEKYKGLKQNRILGIDMNPNYIGLSIIEFDINNEFKILHKQIFDLNKLTISSGKTNNDKKSKYITNKLKYETIIIAHEIDKLVNVWKCNSISIENLKFKNKDINKEKYLNRLCNNKWERNLFVNKLKMLANIHKYDIIEVNPAYSSIIGNIVYGNENTPDMVASSIEIARRAYKKYEKGWFYPKFKIQYLNEQWKQTLGTVENWKELFSKIKKMKLKYRFQLLDYIQNAVLSINYYHKKWKIYIF